MVGDRHLAWKKVFKNGELDCIVLLQMNVDTENKPNNKKKLETVK